MISNLTLDQHRTSDRLDSRVASVRYKHGKINNVNSLVGSDPDQTEPDQIHSGQNQRWKTSKTVNWAETDGKNPFIKSSTIENLSEVMQNEQEVTEWHSMTSGDDGGGGVETIDQIDQFDQLKVSRAKQQRS